jgi:hypothetical protein
LDFLSEFQFDIVHRPGRKHNNADALSRKPCHQCESDDDEKVDASPTARTIQTNPPHKQKFPVSIGKDVQDAIFGAAALQEA